MRNDLAGKRYIQLVFAQAIRFVTIFSFICIILPIGIKAQNNKPQDLNERFKLVETLGSSNETVYQTMFTSKGELFSVVKDQPSGKWSYRIGNKSKDFSPCIDSVYALGFLSKNDKFFSIACQDYTAEVWNLEENKRLVRFQFNRIKDSDFVWPYVSSDGKRLLVTDLFSSTYAQLWDIENAKKIAKLTSESTDCSCYRTVYRVSFSPDEKTIATAHGGMVFLWNAESGKLINKLIDDNAKFYGYAVLSHKGIVSKLLFTKDSKTVITAAQDGTTKSWDVESGKLLQTFKQHIYAIESLALSPDGKTLATGSTSDDFQLWDLQSGRLLWKSPDLKKDVIQVSFNPDGTKVMSITSNQISIWDVSTGSLLEKTSVARNTLPNFNQNWKLLTVFDEKTRITRLYEDSGSH